MDERTTVDGRLSIAAWMASVFTERWVWPLIAIGTTSIVYIAYLFTHPFPAYAGGLYLVIAEQIIEHGYALPTTVPGYTAEGIPFAYPPLMFYVTAAIIDFTAVDPVAVTRYLPGLVVIAALIPYYGIASELLGDDRQAGLATVLLGCTPTVLRWHISAGGLVRAPAFLLALVGIYTGIKLFRTGKQKWLLGSTAVFGLLVLTHPTYTVFLGMSYLLLFAWIDRSLRGVRNGSIVAIGGILLASPWWGQILATHGPHIYATAAGTHGGIAGGPMRLLVEVGHPLIDLDIEWPFFVAAYLGGVYFLYSRRFFLPTWLIASGYVLGKSRFLFVAGSMLTAAFLFEVVVPRLQSPEYSLPGSRGKTVVVLALVTTAAVAAGGVYSAGVVPAAHNNSDSQPAYIDLQDRGALRWVERNTEPSARFVVVGDVAEWFPLFTDRSILLGPWGVEWKNTEEYYHQVALYDAMSACNVASCLSEHLDRQGYHPDYLYVPKGEYTVRGKEHVQSQRMGSSLIESDRFDVVFENEGVIVTRVG